MRAVYCTVLLACAASCLAYRHKDTLFNNFPVDIKRYESLGLSAEVVVPCPVCPGDECEKVNGQYYKTCRFGTHTNYGCNSRMDCYRGPGENCNEDRSWQCERSLTCRENQCRGYSLYGYSDHPNYASKDH